MIDQAIIELNGKTATRVSGVVADRNLDLDSHGAAAISRCRSGWRRRPPVR